ncbi:hypothetical protein NIE88_00255 [Sporolactobacillus shoreicorticis]|uniref:Glycosyltransferase n=1 Tax=Sporolactobacillus shoreicorticis TaxID=1923877 RepID=A0ABW5S4P9_9BACL|nr:glycosyltransferase [Sporolactobacillus shoreicorticis]MCO7124222.1 hypothetical protein [Sporolactobacillus shoreicorticis]
MDDYQTIAYYISDYGYGHVTRSLAIIRRLCDHERIQIIICHAFAFNFINQALSELILAGKVRMRRLENDMGYVLKPHSLQPDRHQLAIKCTRFIHELPLAVKREVSFLRNQHVDLVIGDIPPVPFKAARLVSVPSIGLSNFTWFTAYNSLLPDEVLRPFFDCYKEMDYFFALAGSKEPQWGREANTNVAFFSRPPQMGIVHNIRKSVDPKGNQIVVFFGLGMRINAGNLNAYKLWHSRNCVFLVSENLDIEGETIYKIPGDEAESQNYLAASDLVISKPGWSTVAEAVNAHKPLILVKRNNMPEDEHTIGYLQKHGGCELIRWEQMNKFTITDDLLHQLDKQKNRSMMNSENVLNDLADEIQTILYHKQDGYS